MIKVPGDGKGSLVAWDPVSQTQRWKVEHPTLWNGGTLTTAGRLVFQGTADGWLNAYVQSTARCCGASTRGSALSPRR